MTFKIGHLAPILLIALPLAACDKAEQSAGDSFLRVMGVSSVPPVQSLGALEVVTETPAKAPCVDPGWRLGYCDPVTDELVIYP